MPLLAKIQFGVTVNDTVCTNTHVTDGLKLAFYLILSLIQIILFAASKSGLPGIACFYGTVFKTVLNNARNGLSEPEIIWQIIIKRII